MQRFVASLFGLCFQKRDLVRLREPEPVQPEDGRYNERDPETPSPRLRAVEVIRDQTAGDWAWRIQLARRPERSRMDVHTNSGTREGSHGEETHRGSKFIRCRFLSMGFPLPVFSSGVSTNISRYQSRFQRQPSMPASQTSQPKACRSPTSRYSSQVHSRSGRRRKAPKSEYTRSCGRRPSNNGETRTTNDERIKPYLAHRRKHQRPHGEANDITRGVNHKLCFGCRRVLLTSLIRESQPQS